MHISELRESKYLKKEDCDPPILVTIHHLTQQNVALEGDKPDLRWALHFVEDLKPMILNSTNAQIIAQALGSEETDNWKGKQIVLFNDANVSFQGKLVGGIRVRKPKVKAPAKPAPAPMDDPVLDEPDPDGDEYPF